MGSVQNFFTSRDNNTDVDTYVGQLDRLWYNPDTNSIFVSDGTTPGGVPVALATGANIVANNITVNTITSTSGNVTVTGNLVISGDISPATDTKVGGIKAGPGANVSNDGLLTIDTSGLPLSFGDFTANTNILTLVNEDQNMILATQGNAEVQLVGNIGFYKTDGFPPNVANRYFSASDDGQIRISVSNVDPTSGAVEIIGSTSGLSSSTVNTGVMLHITGQNNDASRFYNDGIGSFAAFVGRRLNGTVASPTAVQAGDEIIRISSTGYNGSAIPGSGSARIVYQAIETYTPSAQGSNLSFWATQVGTTTLSKIATVDYANGVNATMFTTAGNISATGNIAGGNLILGSGGVISSSGLISTTANISAGNISTTGSLSVTGNISAGNVAATNYTGLTTRSVRDAGTIGDGGTLTIDFATDSLVTCVWNNGLTISGSNYTTGRIVKVMALKGVGSGTDSITFNGFTANHISTGSTTQSYGADVTAILEFISTSTAVGGVYIKI